MGRNSSLHALQVLHLPQRLSEDSQAEIQEYAKAVYQLVQPLYPLSMYALLGK